MKSLAAMRPSTPINLQPMKKGLIIILDGLGDRPSPDLEGKTPLEAANTPFMDGLVSRGCCGLVDPLYPGVPVDTHTGCAALMGVAPKDQRRLARGSVEAAGIGLEVEPGDVVIRANCATLGDNGLIIDRRAGRISEGVDTLCESLENLVIADSVLASVFPASHHRAVLRLRGPNLSSAITGTDPGCGGDSRIQVSRALDPANENAVNTAAILNEFSHRACEILGQHPLNQQRASNGELAANGLLFRGVGTVFHPRNLITHLGLKAVVITGERTLNGLGRLSGFDVIQQPGFTGLSDTDLAGKFHSAQHALKDNDLVYVHIKAADLFSHSMDARGKKAFLEQLDKVMNVHVNADCVIAIGADHSTDSNTGRHCGDPVPAVLWSSGCRVDGETTFGETACTRGGLGRISGNGFLLTVLDHMGVLSNYHSFDSVFIGKA
ncbi:MAG: 2,3-bisphosphoglycerate-independent phosphoglycerate mutase [Gammaproteobacteria bacterium]|nr:2,3-bisphosphoglycerate-independent phosphoglycerate mutase [Gammaproteobacteria bacterium]